MSKISWQTALSVVCIIVGLVLVYADCPTSPGLVQIGVKLACIVLLVTVAGANVKR